VRNRLWSLLVVAALLGVGAPILTTTHQALAAPEPAKNPPTPTPKPRAAEVEVVVGTPKVLSVGNFDCSTITTSTAACFDNQAAGKLAVLVQWMPCAAGNCTGNVQTIALYLQPYSDVFPAGQPQSSIATTSFNGTGAVFFLDSFSVGNCYVARAFVGKEVVSAYSPASKPVCVTSSTRVGKEIVNVPATVSGYFYANVPCWQMAPEGNVSQLGGGIYGLTTVGVKPIIGCSKDTQPDGNLSYSVTADFGNTVDPWRMIKATFVVTSGAKCAGLFGIGALFNGIGATPRISGPSLKLAGADALSFDVTAWAKTYGTFYALVPPDADTHCAVPDGIGSIYIRLERLKLPN
jgi:hypothetical protein